MAVSSVGTQLGKESRALFLMVFPELVVDVTNVLESDPEQDLLGSVYMELKLGNLLARPVFHSIQHLQMYGRAYLWKRS